MTQKVLYISLAMIGLSGLFSCGRYESGANTGYLHAPAVEDTRSHAYVKQEMGLFEEEAGKVITDGPIIRPDSVSNTEEYGKMVENPFTDTRHSPASTFSIDVDNASYSNIRRMLNNRQPIPSDAVRIEEMINYFDYDYPDATGQHPFSITLEAAPAPWNAAHQLLHVGIQGKKPDYSLLSKPSNLVFLLDVSGSMSDENKLPLVKESLKLLLGRLSDNDRVAIVVYAGAAGLVLPSTPASQKDKILGAFDKLEAGGSTAGGEGILLAYKIAQENLIPGGNNRIILATDGDFNVGVSDTDELVKLAEEKRKTGVYLTICGYGMGNYKDDRLEQISNKGNGNYFYIDDQKEAEKVFVREMHANLFAIAKDVKLQLEFNPNKVKAYRLIGYENRMLNYEDFNDDTKDAGELGAGHSVTAIYEIIPVGSDSKQAIVTPEGEKQPTVSVSGLVNVKFRYKAPESETSVLLEQGLASAKGDWRQASENFRFSAAVAGWGLLLRNTPYAPELNRKIVRELAENSIGQDPFGDRKEFLQLFSSWETLGK